MTNVPEWIRKQASELIEQAYQRGYKVGREEGFDEWVNTDVNALVEQGRKEAWEAARRLVSMGYLECNKVLGDHVLTIDTVDEIFIRCTASEAIEKLRDYEEQKQQEQDNEIHVGDEVVLNANSCYGPNEKAIIIALDDTNYPYHVMLGSGDTDWIIRDAIDRKTGRTFPQIEEVLKKLQEDK